MQLCLLTVSSAVTPGQSSLWGVGNKEQKTRAHVQGGPEASTCPFQEGVQNMLFNLEGEERDPSCQ